MKIFKLQFCSIYLFRLMLCLMGITSLARGQMVYPKVGQECPEFTFTDVLHYHKQQLSLKDLRGKWVILDCWNRYCTACIKKMPMMSALQQRFEKEVQVLMIGYTGSRYTKRPDEKLIKVLYEENRRDKDLKLTAVFDSLLFKRFDIGACPYVIIIDPHGKIRALTIEITEVEMEKMITGRTVELKKAYRWGEYKTKQLE